MFTKSFRIIVTAVLIVSMTTLSMPMGIAYAAEGIGGQSGTLMGTTGDNLYFKKIADVPPPPPEPEPEQEPVTEPEQDLDNENRTTVGDDKTVADLANTTPEAVEVPEADQDTLEWVFEVKPVKSETITEDGGTRTNYYNEYGELIGYSTQAQGTQTQPTKWFDADGKAIEDKNGDPFEATLVSAGDEQNTVKDKSNETVAWKKVTYSDDNKIETTSYYTIEGKFAASIKKDANNPDAPTWRTGVKAADQGDVTTNLGIKPVWQEETVSADGKTTTTKYFNDAGKEIGSKTVTKTPSGENAEVLVDVTTWNATIVAPVKPPENATIDTWNTYYNDYVAYIGQLDNLGMRKTAWENLSADLLAQAKANPGMISAESINKVMATMTAELKKIYTDSTYTLDVSKAQADIVEAAATFAKSTAFAAMNEATKTGVSWYFTVLGTELAWRKNNNAALDETYNTIYKNIAEFYKTLMQDKSTQVSAISFQHLMGLWRQSVWGSKEGNEAGANQILKDALNFTGGIQGLITSWEAAIDGGNLTVESLGWAESALAQVIWQFPWLNASKQAGGADITDADLTRMAGKITDYLNKVNEGTDAKYQINAGIKNHFINCVGSALIVLMQNDKYNSSQYTEMGEAYIVLADNLLSLPEADGGGVAVQTSVINVTSAILATAKAKLTTDPDNKRMGQFKTQSENVLLNNDTFDMDAYITEANKQMADNTNPALTADYKAWVSIGMNNIQKINLEYKTEVVARQGLKNSIAAIKEWITNPDNLNDMREMDWQAGIYSSLTDLLKEVYKDGSELGLDMLLKKDIAAIFGTLKGLKDSKVKEMGLANANALIDYLKAQDNGDYDVLVELIEDAIAEPTT